MDMKTNKETEVTLTQERVLSIEVSSRITKEKKQMPSIFFGYLSILFSHGWNGIG